jgi:membrane protease YdiL (CAAX protease family)
VLLYEKNNDLEIYFCIPATSYYAFVFVASLFLGWAYEKTGSLLGITLAHGLTNILLFIVLPLTLNLPPMLELPL